MDVVDFVVHLRDRDVMQLRVSQWSSSPVYMWLTLFVSNGRQLKGDAHHGCSHSEQNSVYTVDFRTAHSDLS